MYTLTFFDKEPTCRRPKNLGNFTTKDKTPKKTFNFQYLYHCKQSGIRKPVPLIAVKSYELCVIHVASAT